MLLALAGGQIRLEELGVGIRLQLDHVRRGDDFLDFAEIDTFCGSRWHFKLSVLVRLHAAPIHTDT
jgi:hypothetical protein